MKAKVIFDGLAKSSPSIRIGGLNFGVRDMAFDCEGGKVHVLTADGYRAVDQVSGAVLQYEAGDWIELRRAKRKLKPVKGYQLIEKGKEK